jgi:hypothetical protein
MSANGSENFVMKEDWKSGSQPALSEMLARFLARRASAHAESPLPGDASGEVVPYEAVPAQPVEPRLAWTEAHAALRCFAPTLTPAAQPFTADWATLVASQEPGMAIAFCAGNFPQLVRDIHALLSATDLSELRSMRSEAAAADGGIAGWAAQLAQTDDPANLLLAAGVCRLARHFDQAGELLKQGEKNAPTEWKPAFLNEHAALAWHRGHCERADELWGKQASTAPVLFNQGMAALFLDRAKDARSLLNQAVAQLSEDDGWHHLGKLYLALAEMRA